MSPRSFLQLAVSLALLVAIGAGCVPVSRYIVSAPAALPPPLRGKVDGTGVANLKLFDLDLGLAALDHAQSPTDEVPSFFLLVVFKAGQATYAFDPTKPTVRTTDERVLHPYAYVGPGKYTGGDDWNAFPRGCFAGLRGFWGSYRGRLHDSLPRMTEPRQYAISAKVCFVLAFDVRVKSSIELALEGLDRQGQHQQVPALRFVRRAGRSTIVADRPAILEDLVEHP